MMVFFFFFAELFEAGGFFDAIFVVCRETRDGGVEETKPSAAVGVEVAKGDEALLAPALDGFGGDRELAGDILEFEHGVASGSRFFDADGEGVGKEFDQAREVRAQNLPRHHMIKMRAGLKARNAEMEEIPRIGLGGINVGEEIDDKLQLLAPFFGGGVGELVGQLKDLVIAPRGHNSLIGL